MSRKFFAAGAVALLVASGCGGGGGSSSKSSATTHPKAASTLSTTAYQQRVTAVLYAMRPAGSKLAHAHSDQGIVDSARKLEASWSDAAKTIESLNGPVAAKKVQGRLVAALRKGAGEMQQELSVSHPDRAKLGDVFSRTEAELDPLIQSLYAVP